VFWKRKSGKTESLTLQDHLRLAGEASARADWGHALAHLGWVLEDDPTHPQARALLDRVLRAARDPLGLVSVPRAGEIPFQIAAIRAYIHAWRSQLDQAVSIMAQIYRAVPGLPYLPWLVEWLSPKSALTVEVNAMSALVTALLGKFETGDVEEHDTIERLVPALARYAIDHPQAASTHCIVVILRLMRTLGKVDEAFAIAERAYETSPNHCTAIALAMAHKARGNKEAAVAALRDALKYEPEEIEVRLDIGDILCSTGQVEEGLAAYQEVLAREPRHPWALPFYLYHKALLEPDGPWQRQLEELAAESPDNTQAQDLSSRLQPYRMFLPEPSDATINLLRQAAERQLDVRDFSLNLSALESPSARLAFELYQIERFGKASLTVSIDEIQQPDPRVPHRPTEFVLWRYEGTEPRPAVKPSSCAVADAVSKLAARPYRADAWSQLAHTIAAKLGAKCTGDLLGTMVHLPKRVEPFTIWVWIQRVQVAAAFIIAHLDGGWEGSVCKQTLFSLASGPMDWTVEAAIVALAQVAHEEPAAAQDVAALYLDLLDSLPRPGGVPYLNALLHCSRHLPAAPEELRTRTDLLREALSWDSAESSFGEGMVRYEAGDYDGAIAVLDELIRLQPDFGAAYYVRGAAYRKKGKVGAAIDDYSEAIRLMPQAEELHAVHVNRGVARAKVGDILGALADYNEAIRLNPQCASAYNNWGNLVRGEGRHDAAIACYDSAIRIDPAYALAYTNRGIARGCLGDLEGALADHDEALRLDPQLALAYYNRALPSTRTPANRSGRSTTIVRRCVSIQSSPMPITGAASCAVARVI
jgi:tetratricopeptide (TPR) repeat protein